MGEKVLNSKPETCRENQISQTQKTGPSQPISSPVEQILFLQRTIGNQAVRKLIRSGVLQAKLRIGKPNDIYEQEADRVAEQVMRMPEPKVSKDTEVSIQRKCPKCIKGKPDKKEEEKILQTKEASDSTLEVTPELESNISAIRGGGHPLPDGVRAFYEPRLGHDFGGVRVHTDTQAAESARAVNALAYTVGRDIVFSAGQYAPGTKAGRHLLMHELTHVVQQRGGRSAHLSGISASGDAGEREAEDIADKASAGAIVPSPCVRPGTTVQRKVLNSVLTDFQPDPKIAQACVVHIHGEEQNALAVAKEMRARRCVNLVHLDTTERLITFEVSDGTDTHVCKADPNRIFTDAGRESEAIKTCHKAGGKGETSGVKAVHDAAKGELKAFAENDLGKKIGQCRGGGAAALDGTLPVVALHNNQGLSITEFKKVAETGDKQPTDPTDPSKKLANPTIADPKHLNDFILTTKEEDFLKLRGIRNVVLQANPLPLKGGDDGSLSVALKDARYINVEKEGRKFKLINRGNKFKSNTMTYIENFAMAADALDALGAPDGHCAATDKVLSGNNSAADVIDEVGGAKAPTTEPTEAPVLERDPVPEEPPKGCIVFNDQNALDAQKTIWVKRLGKIPLREIINWIIGGADKPPADAATEIEAQKKCLIDAMRAGASAHGLNIPKGNILKSELRTFKEQRAIWERKFKFTGKPFDRISSFARNKCGTLIDAKHIQWDPKNKNHRLCWGVAKPPEGTTLPQLTGEEREKEILMASAAPGVSRHHAGTDFDFGRTDADLEPEAWTGKGDFADAYRWLVPNAATYGFIQPFNTKGGYGKGYMAERWHWSYYPISQALLEFAKEHQSDIDSELRILWTDRRGIVQEQFKFIMDHWRDYMFNVETKGSF
ncbi:MAG: DUF4157 domain-containing protein [Candidatus Methanoperedens sp.]|nr:DUF4157 domain-containing protein [Candidatus Methanoperedens sp.]